MTDDLDARLRQTFEVVAETTVARPRDPAGSALVGERRSESPPVRRGWWVAAAVVVLGMVAAGIVLSGGGDAVDGPVATHPTTVTTAAPSLSGMDAYLLPPLEIDGLPVQTISAGWSGAMGDGQDGDTPRRSHLDLGGWSMSYGTTSWERSVVYSYLADEAPNGTRATNWLAVLAPAEMERWELHGPEEPRWIEGEDGLSFADLGVICPADVDMPYVITLNGGVSDTCQRRVIGIGPGVLVEMGLEPDVALGPLLAALRIGTLDQLRDEVGSVEGLDQISQEPPEVPVTEPAPPPDTPFCRAWLDVLDATRVNGDAGLLWSPELGSALEAAAAVAPTPQLAADIRQQAVELQMGDQFAVDTDVMMRVVNETEVVCPGARDWGAD